jgi:hypothetical protein
MRKVTLVETAAPAATKDEIATMTGSIAVKYLILSLVYVKRPALVKSFTSADKVESAFMALARDREHARFVKTEYPELVKRIRKDPAKYKEILMKQAAWIFSGSFTKACKKAALYFTNAAKDPDLISETRKQGILKLIGMVETEFNKV